MGKINILTRDGNLEIDCDIIGSLAVHKTTLNFEDETDYRWTVTHPKTGLALVQFISKKDAIKLINELNHLDWEKVTEELKREARPIVLPYRAKGQKWKDKVESMEEANSE